MVTFLLFLFIFLLFLRVFRYQAELDRQTAKIRAQAEGMAAAQAERENREIRDQQILLRAGEDRVTTLEGIKEAGRTVGAVRQLRHHFGGLFFSIAQPNFTLRASCDHALLGAHAYQMLIGACNLTF